MRWAAKQAWELEYPLNDKHGFRYANTKGLNDASDSSKLPRNYSGGIWTDRIDRIQEFKR